MFGSERKPSHRPFIAAPNPRLCVWLMGFLLLWPRLSSAQLAQDPSDEFAPIFLSSEENGSLEDAAEEGSLEDAAEEGSLEDAAEEGSGAAILPIQGDSVPWAHRTGALAPVAPAQTAPPQPPGAKVSRFHLFWQSAFLWKAPIFVSGVAALILGLVGIYVVLRRIVFVTACLANVSGVGVALGLLIGMESQLGQTAGGGRLWYEDIIGLFGFSLLITSLAAAGFAWWRESKRMSSESMLGVAYLVSAGLLVVLASHLNQATHDIDDIVFGSAVVVERSQLIIVPLFAGLLFIVHLVLRNDFLFVSFDPQTAKALKHPVRKLDMVLLITIGLAIAIATRAIGALPVFSLIVLPPLTALILTDRIGLVFFLSPLLGILAASGGYFASFMLAWPVGPTMTLMCTAFLALAPASHLVRRIFR